MLTLATERAIMIILDAESDPGSIIFIFRIIVAGIVVR
jgi:hypothetical protein